MFPNVAVFGSGYVGLVSGVCIADFGLNVTCVDVDECKIDILTKGIIPIYEPGLDVFLERNIKSERIKFTIDAESAINQADVIFIAVGTPTGKDGEADTSYVFQVAEKIGMYMNGYKIIVGKSTVPVGTGQQIKKVIKKILNSRNVSFEFDVVSNPEFLREGKALQDFTHPDRIVIGVESEKAAEIMKKVYRPLYLNDTPFIITNIETAEMIKYACNAFLATKITFINEVANLCEKVGANVQDVAKAMGKDGRIGPKFLHAGPGYGGSCFPKDTKALVQIGKKNNINMSIVKAVIEANENQKHLVIEKLSNELGDIEQKTIGILGLSFKPETDDVRDAPALTIIHELIQRKAKVKAYDPQAINETKKLLKDYDGIVEFCKHAYDTAEGVDSLVILTEWHEFRNMDLILLKKIMNNNVFFDTRNIYQKREVEKVGFRYIETGVQ